MCTGYLDILVHADSGSVGLRGARFILSTKLPATARLLVQGPHFEKQDAGEAKVAQTMPPPLCVLLGVRLQDRVAPFLHPWGSGHLKCSLASCPVTGSSMRPIAGYGGRLGWGKAGSAAADPRLGSRAGMLEG